MQMMHLSESSTSSTLFTGAAAAGAASDPGAATGVTVTIGGAALEEIGAAAGAGTGVGAAGHEILSPGGRQSFLWNFQCVVWCSFEQYLTSWHREHFSGAGLEHPGKPHECKTHVTEDLDVFMRPAFVRRFLNKWSNP